MDKWLLTTFFEAGMVLLGVAILYAGLIVYTRLSGLRSFSQMSSFDFATNVAFGSMFAATALNPSPSVLLGLVGLGALFLGQVAIALLRQKSNTIGRALFNEPRLLMMNGEMRHDAMRECRVTEDDLIAKLREANVLCFEEVAAVVFETTGDVSVLHGDGSQELDARLLQGVEGRDVFEAAQA